MPEQHIGVGGSHWDTIDYAGDHDTYGIYLDGGQWYDFDVYGLAWNAGYVGDPTLGVTDYWGLFQYTFNDDFGGTLNSHIDFYAADSGWYALDVGAYADAYTGWYLLVA